MKTHSFFHRLTAGMILLAYAAGIAVPAVGAAPVTGSGPGLPAMNDGWIPPAPVKSKRARLHRAKKVTPPSFKAASLEDPSLDELNGHRALKTPLRTLRGKNVSKKDKQDLARQMKAFAEDRSGSQEKRLRHLSRFADEHPDSGLTASVHLEVAISAAASGDFVLAQQSYMAAWTLLKNETVQKELIKQAEAALGNLAMVYARTGQKQALTALFEEIKNRPAHITSVEMLGEAREVLALWKTEPLASLECGVTAYNFLAEQKGQPQLAKHGQSWEENEEKAAEEVAANKELIEKGLSAADLLDRILNAGAEYRLVKRISGDSIPLPSVVHLKFGEETGHYSALLSGDASQSFVRDPHLRFDGLMENAVLNKMASGFFIVRADAQLPEGFEDAADEDHFNVRGRTSCPSGKDSEGDDKEKCKKGCKGMPDYSFSSFKGGLIFRDDPLTYQPVYGPGIDFSLSYREISTDFEDITSETSNFGPGWTHGLTSYIAAESLTRLPAPTAMKWKQSDGTYYRYTWNGTGFDSRFASRPQLAVMSGSSGYKLTFPDGSVMEFGQPNGSVITRFYLSKITNPQGQSLTLGYDSLLRLATITDAPGKVSTFEYDGTSLQVSKIIDPFSREAVFTYDGNGRLESITDTLGLTSSFTYSGNLVTQMVTPYGTHTFFNESMSVTDGTYGTASGTARVAVDPQGDQERCVQIYHDGHIKATSLETRPPISINVGTTATPFHTTVWLTDHFHTTLQWTKKYWREYLKAKKTNPATDPYDYAEATLWLMSPTGYSTPVPHAHKLPGVAMEWYNYPGQTATDAFRIGTDDKPIKAARMIENNAGVSTWVMKQMTYNALGMPLTSKDEMGRTYAAVYATNNIDLVASRVTSASGGILRMFENYNRHLPGRIREASGLLQDMTRNAADQVSQLVISKGTNPSVTYNYTYDQDGQGVPDGQPGFLREVQFVGDVYFTQSKYAYDDHGRLASYANELNYTITYDYDDFDRLTLITHPDGTTEQLVYTLLDQTAKKDRAGRWTRTLYNSIRQPILEIAWDGKNTRYDWCRCGKLYKLTDPAGRVTEWKLDTLGRVTEKLMPDGITKTTYTYQPRSGLLATMKRPNEQSGALPTVTYSYHLNGALGKEKYIGTLTPEVTYAYEPAAPGRLTSVVDGIGTHSLAYVALHTTAPGATGNEGAGKLLTYNSPFANESLTYAYDWRDRFAGSSLSGSTAAQMRFENYLYETWGPLQIVERNLYGYVAYGHWSGHPRITSITQISAALVETLFEYYPENATNARSNKIKSVEIRADWATDSFVNFQQSKHTLDYDPAGRIIERDVKIRGLSDFKERLSYNSSDELTHYVKRNASNVVLDQASWSYDQAGNWLSYGTPTNVTTRQHDASTNRLTSQGGAGDTKVEGKVNEFSTVKVNSQKVPLISDPATGGYSFSAQVPVTVGPNTVAVEAKDETDDNLTTSQTWSFNAAPAGSSYTYDANGNMLSDGIRTFTWDAKDRLLKVTLGGAVYHWDYDWQDRRVREFRYASSVAKPVIPTKQFIWDGDQIIRERTGTSATAGTITRTYFTGGFADGPTMTEPYMTTQDALGNVRDIITADAGMTGRFGQVVTRYEYSPYLESSAFYRLGGEPDVDTNLRINGRYYHHAETGLELAKYRAYDPKLGRFISEDPLGEAGGLNLYGYVGNNPFNAVDPLGLAEYPYNFVGPLGPDDFWGPPEAPPGVSCDANMRQATTDFNYLPDFLAQVRTGAPWDYKQAGSRYEDFGNFNFGATGAAAGFNRNLLLRGAGLVQIKSKTSSPEWGSPLNHSCDQSYGDDPKDQAAIKAGMRYHDMKENWRIPMRLPNDPLP